MRLDAALDSRDNSFNLIRFAAASLVLFSHSFTVVTGDRSTEPLRLSLGVTTGSISVDVFFIVSGLLVTGSLVRSDSLVDYVAARALRILPGLFVSLLVTGVAMAIWKHDSVDIHELTFYILRNSLPFGMLADHIGGIFEGNPAGRLFNASLWTLPIEVRMYRNVLLIWLLSFVALGHRRKAFDLLIVLAAAYFAFMHLIVGSHEAVETSPSRLQFMFFAGAAALVAKRYIRFERSALALALAALLLSTLARPAFYLAYSLLLGYIVLGLAYLPRGRVLRFNRLGDYSFGIYIYAWPVQQAVVASIPGIGVGAHIAISAAIVLSLSVLSWHVVEEPMLKLKKRLLNRSRRTPTLADRSTG